MLTRKQYQLLTFIHERIQEAGIPPSFDEMKLALDLKSKSGIHRLIMALEERGFIRRLPHRARAIEILKLPERMEKDKPSAAAVAATASAPAAAPTPFRPSLVEGRGKPTEKLAEKPLVLGGAVEVPLLGRIAAGLPILAESNIESYLPFPTSLLRRSGPYYALRVKGDSMIEMGIFDGDLAVISVAETAENGDVVVARVGEEEATLKRFRRRGGAIALEPANAAYDPQIYRPEQVTIQGKLAGIFRPI